MKAIDLFSGTGGFSLVLHKYDIEIVFSNDMDNSAQQIYLVNFPNSNFVVQDLNTIPLDSIPPHDLLCAGFPCQPFSIAGKQLGFEDERSNVIWKMIDIIRYHKPKCIILENVKNIQSRIHYIKSRIEELGYLIKIGILDTQFTGIPQHRERLYLVGFLDPISYDKFQFECPKHVLRPISDFLEKTIPEKYYYTSKYKIYEELKKNVVRTIDTNTVYQYRRYYVREGKRNCCPTLTANMGTGGHNVPIIKDHIGIRKLTPRECFNLQGFPREYELSNLSDAKLYKLAGNAVSIPIVENIISKLTQFLTDK